MMEERKNAPMNGIENSHCMEMKIPLIQYLFIETI